MCRVGSPPRGGPQNPHHRAHPPCRCGFRKPAPPASPPGLRGDTLSRAEGAFTVSGPCGGFPYLLKLTRRARSARSLPRCASQPGRRAEMSPPGLTRCLCPAEACLAPEGDAPPTASRPDAQQDRRPAPGAPGAGA